MLGLTWYAVHLSFPPATFTLVNVALTDGQSGGVIYLQWEYTFGVHGFVPDGYLSSSLLLSSLELSDTNVY